MKELTVGWLENWDACSDGIAWFKSCGNVNDAEVMESLLVENKLDWANWLVVRLLVREDAIRYAIFAAEQVIGIFESEFHDDVRPRRAIDAALAVLNQNNEETRAAARSAADAAAGAAGDAWAARAAVWAAGDAAGSAAGSAACAAWAAWAAAGSAAGSAARSAAGSAADAAAWAARAARAAARSAAGAAACDETKLKIIRYGMGLRFGEEAK